MLPRLPRAATTRSTSPLPVCRDLDTLLFTDDAWFAIDAHNQRVPRVQIPTLQEGLALLGQGDVATLVGRLRPGVAAIDIDVAGVTGDAITEQIAAWCRASRLWHLVRPSGGADGHHHVFIAGADPAAVVDMVATVRERWRVSPKRVDLRTSIRPLSAPHRHHDPTAGLERCAPLGNLAEARRTFPRLVEGEPARAPRAARDEALPNQRDTRHQRPLPGPWETYLATGAAPRIGGDDQSRSAVELVCTGHMVRAGHTADTAWARIVQAHPSAMSRAKESKTRWLRYAWNRAVERDNQHRAHSRTHDPVVAAAVHAARKRLSDLAWATTPRARPTVLLVGHVLLDRALRASTLKVPCAERDLVLDTGIRDRKTIRKTLALLDGTVGDLHRCFDPGRRRRSSHEFSIETSTSEGVSEIPPPCVTHPHAQAGPTQPWLALPRPAHALWRALAATHGTPQTLTAVTQAAHMTDTPTADPTPSQLRSAQTALRQLQAVGLAHCSASGDWTVGLDWSKPHSDNAIDAQLALVETIQQERADYRRGQSSTWEADRAAALKQARARQKAWWNGLPAAERAQRRTLRAREFAALTVHQQRTAKATWATRRTAAGEDEAQRHDDWLSAQEPDRLVAESIRRAHDFRTLPPPLQAATVRAWQDHREQFGIPRGGPAATIRREHTELLPDRERDRDRNFLTEVGQPAQQTFNVVLRQA